MTIFYSPLAKLHLLHCQNHSSLSFSHLWHKTVNMTVCSYNFVKFTVIKPNCQKHSEYVFASGKNAMYPSLLYATLLLIQVNIDECELEPCQNNGNCTDKINDYDCKCEPGFQGKFSFPHMGSEPQIFFYKDMFLMLFWLG